MHSIRCLLVSVVVSVFLCSAVTATGLPKTVITLNDEADPVIAWLTQLIENVRILLVNGIPELEVAPFDPVELGSVHVPSFANGSDVVSEASADVWSMVKTGLSNFNLDDLEFKALTLSGRTQISWPQLEFTGSYSASGLVYGQSAVASGDLDIDFLDIVLNSSIAIFLNGTTPQVSSLTIDLDLGSSAVTLSNLVGSVELQDAFQASIQELVNQKYENIVATLDGLAASLTDILNGFFAHIEFCMNFSYRLPVLGRHPEQQTAPD